MSIKDRILKRRERFAYERAHWVDADPEESWFYLMTNIQRNNLYSLVLIGPAIFCILFYYFTGITPNIALSYLIIDMIVIFAKRHFAIRRIREDQAYARLGDRTEVLLQMARELSEKDQMKREQNTDHTDKRDKNKDTGEEEGQTKETKERVTLRPGSVRVLHDFDKFTQNTDLRIGEVFYLDDRSVGIGRGSSENIVRGCVIDISQCDQALQTGVTLRFLISAD